MDKILIICDDVRLRNLIKDYIADSNYRYLLIDSQEQDSIDFYVYRFLLIVIFRANPLEIKEEISAIRMRTKAPIMMIASDNRLKTKEIIFRSGVDEYIVQELNMEELRIRAEVLIRRYTDMLYDTKKVQYSIHAGEIVIQPYCRRVFIRDKVLKLSRLEFDLLYYLRQRHDIALSKEHLYSAVWKGECENINNTVSWTVNNLRKKIERDPRSPQYIRTVWGVGYCFNLNWEGMS